MAAVAPVRGEPGGPTRRVRFVPGEPGHLQGVLPHVLPPPQAVHSPLRPVRASPSTSHTHTRAPEPDHRARTNAHDHRARRHIPVTTENKPILDDTTELEAELT